MIHLMVELPDVGVMMSERFKVFQGPVPMEFGLQQRLAISCPGTILSFNLKEKPWSAPNLEDAFLEFYIWCLTWST